MLRKSSNGGLRGLITPGLALALIGLMALAVPAGAAPQYFDIASSGATWDDGITANWGGAPGGPYDAAWAAGSDATFEGTAGAVSVSGAITGVNAVNFTVPGYSLSGGSLMFTANGATMDVAVASGTATVGSDITVFGSLATDQSNILTKSGAGKLILSGTNRIATNTAGAKYSYFKVNGGGEMEITGTLITTQQLAANKGAPTAFVGDASAGNTLRVSGTGRLWTNDITIGANGNNNNSMIVSSPGTSLDPSVMFYGDSPQLNMNSSGNSLSILNGAYIANTSASGSPGWTLGTAAGNNDNSLLIDGAGSTLARTSSGFLNAGIGGDNNTVIVQNQGTLVGSGKLGIGTAGGDNNYILITGAGSAHKAGNASSNGWIDIGQVDGSVNNSYRVENGAVAELAGTNAGRRMAVGMAVGADNNYISVTGATSSLTLVHTLIPLTIGGSVNSGGTISGGTGNHLDIYSGATLDMNNLDAATVTVPTGSMAIVLLGTNSAMNLGNGTGISTAAVGASGLYATGVELRNADGRLNINSGRLIAGVAGNLVSGAGQVNLIGDAYFATDLDVNIASAIYGAGSLAKEGAGILNVTAAYSYTGDTSVLGGTLTLNTATLADAADVIITGGMINLNTGEVDTIHSLYIGGSAKAIGVWGAIGSGAQFESAAITGSGMLNVTAVPEPATMSLLVLGGIAMISRRRRVA